MMKLSWVLCVGALLFVAGCDDDKGVDSEDFGPEGRLYVLNQADRTMYVYDTKTLTRVDSIDTRVGKPHYIEFSPDGQNFYITTLEPTGQIAKFDAATNDFITSLTVPPAVQPSAIAITADSKYGYVCNFSLPGHIAPIHKFDLETMQHLDGVVLQSGVLTHDLKITSDGSVVVACSRNSDKITLVYPDADTVVIFSIDPDSVYGISSESKYGPMGIIIDNRDSLAFIACMNAFQVRVLDIAAQQIVDSILNIPVDTTGTAFIFGPTLLAVSPDNDVVFVTTQGGNSVVAMRVSTNDTLANIPFSTPNPFGITMSDDGSRIYAACVGSAAGHGRVYVIDGSSYAKLDSIDVGKESFGLIWRPL